MTKKLLFWLMLSIGGVMGFTLHSPVFRGGGQIPSQYTCDKNNISPPLIWQTVPVKAKSLVLIMEDPDAPNGPWVHWILFNIPATVHELPENIKTLPTGTQIGMNSWHHNDYAGPCPPSGTHRYSFKLFALDTQLDLPNGADKSTIEIAMQKHILATAELVGKYEHKEKTLQL